MFLGSFCTDHLAPPLVVRYAKAPPDVESLEPTASQTELEGQAIPTRATSEGTAEGSVELTHVVPPFVVLKAPGPTPAQSEVDKQATPVGAMLGGAAVEFSHLAPLVCTMKSLVKLATQTDIVAHAMELTSWPAKGALATSIVPRTNTPPVGGTSELALA